MGYLFINIPLLVLSTFYLLYVIFNRKEFYTKEHKFRDKSIKLSVKVIKYALNITVVTLSLITIVNNKDNRNDINIIMTILLMLSIVLMIIFDILILIIDNQFALIESAFLYDVTNFKKNSKFLKGVLKYIGKIDVHEIFPDDFDDEKKIDKLKEINDKQTAKQTRKKEFKKLLRKDKKVSSK